MACISKGLLVSGTTSPPSDHCERRSHLVKLRRGFAFLGMTLVLPGSAQLTAGNARLGRIALRIWAGLWAALVLTALVCLAWRHAAIALAASTVTLRLLQILFIMIGVAWAGLMVDAWRLSRPPELARRHRLGFATLSLVMAFLVGGTLFASASVVGTQRDLMASVFAGGGHRHPHNGRINVLLMGGDAGSDRVGLRPDSMTVASIDADTGRTALFSLPRNMQHVPFPKSSPMRGKFVRSQQCPDHSCMLNAVYTYASGHRDLYPKATNPGAKATAEAAEAITGLQINYWALIDLKGFKNLINAVGGITVNVNKPVPIGGGSTKVSGYVKAGKHRHLNGYHALWFARSRHADSDYERMARQKCVMSAMLDQLDPMTVLTRFNKIAKASKQIVATNVPRSAINQLIDLAKKARRHPVASVAFVPPMIEPADPDYAQIKQTVQSTLHPAARKKHPGGGASSAASGKPQRHRSSSGSQHPKLHTNNAPKHTKTGGSGHDDKTAKHTDDLQKVCSA
jgi:LCP family protein required for cell wall assembly